MRRAFFTASFFVIFLLASCGGGGSSTKTADNQFPILVQSNNFQFAPIAQAPERIMEVGKQRGRVILLVGTSAPAGLAVDLIDAAQSASPQVLASATTDANGDFSIPEIKTVPASDLLLRATLVDGSQLRAYATGWTVISPGTEVAVAEIMRLRKAGALAAHALTKVELSAAQESLTLLWQGKYEGQTTAAALIALPIYVRTHAAWNKLLNQFSQSVPSEGAGDIAGLMPVAQTIWPSSFTSNATGTNVTSEVNFEGNCNPLGLPDIKLCGIVTSADSSLNESYKLLQTGVVLTPNTTNYDPNNLLTNLFLQVGEYQMIEFPYVMGTRVLYDNPKFTLQLNPAIRASVKITRHTYPSEAVQSLGRTVQAVQVVHDYEIAILNTVNNQQIDLLARERRWFSPENGRVRVESTVQIRTGPTVATVNIEVVAKSVNGKFVDAPVSPLPGIADVYSIPLRHRHAVYSKVLNRIYVATDNGIGQIHELDANTLATLRKINTPALPTRLAVSQDGTRLYGAFDGGVALELRISDLSVVRQLQLPLPQTADVQYNQIYDLSVDPYDASRVLLLVGDNRAYGGISKAIFLYKNGALVQLDGPFYQPIYNYGWGDTLLGLIAWASMRDEFIAAETGSPYSIHRLRIGATSVVEVSSLLRVSSIGIEDVAGEIIINNGDVVDTAFATVRTLGNNQLRFDECNRLDASSAICFLLDAATYDGVTYKPVYGHFDYSTGQILGAYRQEAAEVANGCFGDGTEPAKINARASYVGTLNGGRSLFSYISPTDAIHRCTLQILTLRGAYP
jgi:hypothetical protein